jgi:hypothetical protein
MQVREYESPGLGGMYGDEHDDGYSQTGGSYCAAVYQQRPELTSTNYFKHELFQPRYIAIQSVRRRAHNFFGSPD